MTFNGIIKALSVKEHMDECQICTEMEEAVRQAGLRCSPQELIENVVALIVSKDYIS